jgi:hypothetical protein
MNEDEVRWHLEMQRYVRRARYAGDAIKLIILCLLVWGWVSWIQ